MPNETEVQSAMWGIMNTAKFTHIYIEKRIRDNPLTGQIISKFPQAVCVEIDHYKDLFGRRRQAFSLQKEHQALILASGRDEVLYKGAPVCQDFGNEYFYYTSCVMNCIYNCAYCYLRGMYSSGNLVVFVDLERTFEKVEALLKKSPVYLCVSYDTDLLALEGITGFVEKWCDFTHRHLNLSIEIRTKCASKSIFERITPCDRVIFAYTLSPEEMIKRFEHGTPHLADRLEAAATAMEKGHPVRLCFDPVLYTKDWEDNYRKLIEQTFARVDASKVRDVSIGSFRISTEYLKKMREAEPEEPLVQYPFENVDGVYQYPEEIRLRMEEFLCDEVSKYVSREKLFLWRESDT